MLNRLKTYFPKNNKETTPLPKAIISITFFLMLFNGMVMTMVYSYLPEMVKSFGISEVNTGYYAGFIASSLYIGRTLFSSVWGYVADVKGRKKAAIACSVCLSFATLAFGFSYNIYWASITRFLQGSFMGINVVGKTMVGDQCDDTNISLAMTIIMSALSFGFALGPSLAGFLVFPGVQYPNLFSSDNIFARFGVLIPNLIITIGLWISTILMIVYFPNDDRCRGKSKNKPFRKLGGESSYLIQPDSSNRYYMEEDDKQTNSETYMNLSIKDNNYANQEGNEDENKMRYFLILEDSTTSIPVKEKSLINRMKKMKILQVLREKWCMILCCLYAVLSLCGTGFNEMFPLYSATSTDFNGIGFPPSKIGIALLGAATILIVVQIVVLSRLTRKFGSKHVLICSIIIFAIVVPFLPLIGMNRNTSVLWTTLLVYLIIARISSATIFVTISILINNSVHPDLLSSANGLAASFSCLGRSIAPTFFGSIYSWSLTNIKGIEENNEAIGFPFNQYFAFFMLSIIPILSCVGAYQLPRSLDNKFPSQRNTEEIPKTRHVTTITTSLYTPWEKI